MFRGSNPSNPSFFGVLCGAKKRKKYTSIFDRFPVLITKKTGFRTVDRPPESPKLPDFALFLPKRKNPFCLGRQKRVLFCLRTTKRYKTELRTPKSTPVGLYYMASFGKSNLIVNYSKCPLFQLICFAALFICCKRKLFF